MMMCLTRIWWRAQTSQDLNYSLAEIDLGLGTKCGIWTPFWTPFWEKLHWYLQFRAHKLDQKWSGRTRTHGHTYERTHMIFWDLPYTISPSGNYTPARVLSFNREQSKGVGWSYGDQLLTRRYIRSGTTHDTPQCDAEFKPMFNNRRLTKYAPRRQNQNDCD